MGLGSIVKGIVGSVTGGDVLGFAGGLLGGQQANSATAASTQAQMDFQERMRATQYQTQVKDLRKAGLNPRLAYQSPPAGVPSGASYSARDVSQSAREGLMASATRQNLQQQNALIKAQELAAVSSAKAANAQAGKLAAETQGIQSENVGKEINAQWQKLFGVTGAGVKGATGLLSGLTNSAKSVASIASPNKAIGSLLRKLIFKK